MSIRLEVETLEKQIAGADAAGEEEKKRQLNRKLTNLLQTKSGKEYMKRREEWE